ncbi:MAG: holin family protein [Butyricicoccaceae bacterium]
MNLMEYLTTANSVGVFVLILLGAVGLDYLTGLAKAWHEGSLRSRIAKDGLIRKMTLFAVVGACGLIDLVLPVETGYGVCKLSAISFIISEVLSILENAAAVGVPIPESITRRLAQLSEPNGKEGSHANCD